MSYLSQPLTTGMYHLTEIIFFLSMALALFIIYRQNQIAIWAKENPMQLLPLPAGRRPHRTRTRRARLVRWLKLQIARTILRLQGQPTQLPAHESRVSTWNPKSRMASASRRMIL